MTRLFKQLKHKNMKELNEIQFDHENIILNSNKVQGSILPKNVGELDRDVKIQKDTIIEGAVYGHKIEVESGDVEVKGAAFAQLEIYINSGAKGVVKFEKSIGAVESIVSHARDCKVMLLSDVNAREVRLTNAFVGGSIFADDITLVNCVVIGGVFANKELSLSSCIVGTFNAPSVTMEGDNSLLLPGGYLNPARNFPPLGETIATAAGASVLGFEHGMSAHRCLFAVIRWIRRGEPSPYKVFAMATNGRQPLLGDVLPIRSRKMEPAPELRLRQPRKS